MSKILEVSKLFKRQEDLIKKIIKLNKLPKTDKYKIITNRVYKIINYAILIRQIEVQKQIIISQPLPRFEKGSVEVGNNNREEIVLNK